MRTRFNANKDGAMLLITILKRLLIKELKIDNIMISGIVLVCISALILFFNAEKMFLTLLCALGISIGTIILCASIESEQPQPIDVYRGNTTLKINYVDGVPVDSVVIFRNSK